MERTLLKLVRKDVRSMAEEVNLGQCAEKPLSNHLIMPISVLSLKKL